MKQAIVNELKRLGADSALSTVDPRVIRASLRAELIQFETVLSELTDYEVVGMVVGEIYLRQTES